MHSTVQRRITVEFPLDGTIWRQTVDWDMRELRPDTFGEYLRRDLGLSEDVVRVTVQSIKEQLGSSTPQPQRSIAVPDFDAMSDMYAQQAQAGLSRTNTMNSVSSFNQTQQHTASVVAAEPGQKRPKSKPGLKTCPKCGDSMGNSTKICKKCNHVFQRKKDREAAEQAATGIVVGASQVTQQSIFCCPANQLSANALSDFRAMAAAIDMNPSLTHSDTWPTILGAIIEQLSLHASAGPFNSPVDQVAVPGYLSVISGAGKMPMDFSTVAKKIREGLYASMPLCLVDVRMIWQNCRIYNRAGANIIIQSNALSILFDLLLARYADRFLHPHERQTESIIRRTEHETRLRDTQAAVAAQAGTLQGGVY